ncbi:hypothetical protein [uncultured Lacinutrix sp.]|uniref:hypothetical protein n=1 Tax=uncultured Lacinutrix sp. TaxID=574032 RepID=UPI00261AE65E|nr:hypothetical protein [uncultured Lacinutrix sp.]
MKKKHLLLTVIFAAILLVCCKSLHISPFNPEVLANHLISSDRANNIKELYKTDRIDLLDDILKDRYNNNEFRDSKFAWFSLEKMKSYINYIEAINSANPEKVVSGIRIYFAAYPNQSNEEHPGKQTIFMVPTVKTAFNDTEFEIMNHLPFEVQPSNSNMPLKGEFKILDDLMLRYKKDERYSLYSNNSNNSQRIGISSNTTSSQLMREDVTKTILNEGDLAPPPE